MGLGAATCQQFIDDVRSNAQVRRDYLAWPQGFYKWNYLEQAARRGRRPNLNPAAFGLIEQLRFLEDHCAQNAELNFSEAVEALYKRLRQEGRT